MNLTCFTFILYTWLLLYYIYIYIVQCFAACRFVLIIQIDIL